MTIAIDSLFIYRSANRIIFEEGQWRTFLSGIAISVGANLLAYFGVLQSILSPIGIFALLCLTIFWGVYVVRIFFSCDGGFINLLFSLTFLIAPILFVQAASVIDGDQIEFISLALMVMIASVFFALVVSGALNICRWYLR